ncbi:HDOD domain-containing protein [Deltaproteobacteria bacterium TL4]
MDSQHSVIIPVGGLYVSSNPDEILATCTASCVAVAFYDPQTRIAGLLHVVLPGRRNSPRHNNPQSYYADTGVPLLLESMLKAGARKESLRATLVGGSRSIDSKDGVNDDIGSQNVDEITKLLAQANIPVYKKEVRGKKNRSIELNVKNGKVTISQISEKRPKTNNHSGIETRSSQATLLRNMSELQPDPQVAGTLLEAVHRKSIAWNEVFGIIVQDVILTMQVLRLCNSKQYGRPHEISSLPSALELLGAKQLRRICVIAGVRRQTEKKLDDFGIVTSRLNRHGWTCAVIAQYLARRIHYEFDQELFTAAMLHDVAKIAQALLPPKTVLERTEAQANSPGASPLVMATNEVEGLEQLILSHWQFPESMIAALAHSLKSPYSQNKESLLPATLLRLSCDLSKLLGLSSTTECFVANLNRFDLAEIGLSDSFDNVLLAIINELQSNPFPGA